MQIEIVVLIIFGIWLSALTFFLYIYLNLFNRLKKGAKRENLKVILESILESQAREKDELASLDKNIKRLEDESNYYIQKMALVRFNPFKDLGGDHSFSLAILDRRQTGVIITSLHTRERTRLYMKSIRNGKSDHELSAEEREALAKAKSDN